MPKGDGYGEDRTISTRTASPLSVTRSCSEPQSPPSLTTSVVRVWVSVQSLGISCSLALADSAMLGEEGEEEEEEEDELGSLISTTSALAVCVSRECVLSLPAAQISTSTSTSTSCSRICVS